MHHLTWEPVGQYDYTSLDRCKSVDQGTLYLLSLLYIFLYNHYLMYFEVNFSYKFYYICFMKI
jgi:hypothetical protein